jgi:Ca2+-binding RTX toxin-like protein
MSGSQPTIAATAVDFVDSIGVNTHVAYIGSPYSNVSVVENALNYLGVKYVRDLNPSSYVLSDYETLAADGIQFDLIISNTGTVDLPTDIAQLATFEAADPGSIVSIEGPNELNAAYNDVTFNGQSATDPAVADQIMQALNQDLQNTPSLASIQLLNASVSEGVPDWDTYESGLGNESAYVDQANAHVYATQGAEPGPKLLYELPHAQESVPQGGMTITETGYSTAIYDTSGWGGVDQITQAKEILNDLMDAFKDGVTRTYIYDLLNDANDPTDSSIGDNFGLFQTDGTPKLAATAIHDLTTILADNGAGAATFVPGSLNYSLTNLPSTGNSLLLEKSDGAFDIVVWAEPTIWNSTTLTDIAVASTAVVVNLGATYQNVEVFDPLVGTAPIATYSNVSTVTIGVTDHPLIVEVEPYTITTGKTGQVVTLGATNTVVDSYGADTVLVGTANATVNAYGPSITVQGGTGALNYTGTARATIIGGAGAMSLTLSGSGSSITGGSGSLTVVDDAGGNTITGGPGANNNGITVTTTTGNDLIQTGLGTLTNVINLGAGNDTVIANGASDITGSTGNDTITVNQWTGDVVTSTGASTVTFTVGGEVTTNGTDTVISRAGSLSVIADGPATTVYGGTGFMWFSGTGNATIVGGIGGGNFDFTGAGTDKICTVRGAIDTIELGAGGASINSNGTDTIYMGSGAATVVASGPSIDIQGGSGTLTYGGSASATVVAGTGYVNATLSGSGSSITGGSGGLRVYDLVGGNTIIGGAGANNNGIKVTTTIGDDLIETGLGTLTNAISLGAGNDTVIANGASNIFGSTGNDTITVNQWTATVTTSTGSSLVTFNVGGTVNTHGTDTIVSNAGVLTVNAIGPSTTVTGGSGFLWFTSYGAGNATITGGSGGGNFTFTGTGVDQLTTAVGASDTIQLGRGAATINCQGNDTILGGTGNATITGGAGAVIVTFNGGGSTVTGGSGGLQVLDQAGGNTVIGGAGANNNGINVTTTTGNDLIETGLSTLTNTITLGAGNDTVIANGASVITGSTGNDTITVNQWTGTVTTGTGASLVTFNVGGTVNTHGTDTVVSNAGVLTVNAMGPSTTVTGGSGFLWFSGSGNATITGGSGGGSFNFAGNATDQLTTAAGATDTIQLGAGPDTINSAGKDTIHASSGASTIQGIGSSTASMTFYGGNGASNLIAGAGTVTATTGAGALTMDLGSGHDTVNGGSGAGDVFTFISGMGGGTDLITGFRTGTDHVSYQGVSVVSDSVTSAGFNVVLSDGSHVTYAGFTSPVSSILNGT